MRERKSNLPSLEEMKALVEAMKETHQAKLSSQLYKAVGDDDAQAVREILDQGADANRAVPIKSRKKNEQAQPIEEARSPEVFELLVGSGAVVPSDPRTQLYMLANAAREGRIDMLNHLHEQGFTTHLSSNRYKHHPLESHPLGASITEGQVEAAKWLLDHGADPNCPVKLDRHLELRPMDMAFLMHKVDRDPKLEIGKMLVDAGANPQLCQVNSIYEDDRMRFQSAMRVHALTKVAQQTRQEELATPEEALAARKRGRMM